MSKEARDQIEVKFYELYGTPAAFATAAGQARHVTCRSAGGTNRSRDALRASGPALAWQGVYAPTGQGPVPSYLEVRNTRTLHALEQGAQVVFHVRLCKWPAIFLNHQKAQW